MLGVVSRCLEGWVLAVSGFGLSTWCWLRCCCQVELVMAEACLCFCVVVLFFGSFIGSSLFLLLLFVFCFVPVLLEWNIGGILVSFRW